MRKGNMIKIAAVVIAVCAIFVFSFAAAPTDSYSYKVILPDTPLYSGTDLSSEVSILLPQNAIVEVEGEILNFSDIRWIKVTYTGIEGYVVYESLYRSIANDSYKVRPVTIVSKSMGKDVELYDTHLENAAPVLMVHDGEKVSLVSNGVDYGDFSYIEYGGKYYFVKSDNITTGLGYNQKLAVIISCSFVGVVFIAIALIVILKRKALTK